MYLILFFLFVFYLTGLAICFVFLNLEYQESTNSHLDDYLKLKKIKEITIYLGFTLILMSIRIILPKEYDFLLDIIIFINVLYYGMTIIAESIGDRLSDEKIYMFYKYSINPIKISFDKYLARIYHEHIVMKNIKNKKE